MQSTLVAILLLLSITSSEVASQFCSYNATENKVGVIDCGEPPENVQVIYMSQADIPEIRKGLFTPFKKLTSINIGRTSLGKIEPGAFDGLKLKYLKLNSNGIKNIENGTLNTLDTTTYFEIAGNKLESLEANTFLGMTSLNWISISANKIKTIDKEAFNGLGKLEYLHMIFNDVESLELGTFDSLVSLKLLDLSHNSLKEIKLGLFSQQRRLETLSLPNNNLESLPDRLFANVTALERLDVYGNKLRELQENLFYGIENLKTLKMYHNNITQFNTKDILVLLPKLSEVELFGNPWQCEDLKKMKEDFIKSKVFVPIPVPVYNTANIDGIACKE